MAEANKVEYAPGSARLKPEFIITNHILEVNEKYVASSNKNKNSSSCDIEPPKKKLKGQNKHRPREKRAPKSEKLCFNIGKYGTCSHGDNCCYTHDLNLYLSKKPKDIGENCYLFETFGYCPYSFSCRFASKHIQDGKNVINEEVWNKFKDNQMIINTLSKELQISLRKRQYNFQKSDKFVKLFESQTQEKNLNVKIETVQKEEKIRFNEDQCINKLTSENSANINSNTDFEKKELKNCESNVAQAEKNKIAEYSTEFSEIDVCPSGTVTDEDVIPLRSSEIRKIDFSNKLYLAPLTTVGNLPFRRICKEFGADITCGEMAMAANLLQGQQSEWALMKRHYTEDIFGVQICGAHPDVMTRCSQLLTENISVDFIDINMGCPLDFVYNKGAGSGLMHRLKKLEGIIYGITSVINIPLTLKMRTGVFKNEIAHNVINKIHQWGNNVDLITIHGRSRDQRYTKTADWNYITYCNELAKPIPLFGNGDILSYEDYNVHLKESKVSGIMIARGALLKPWIFKEIKEQKHWDISSSERFETLKTYVNYGLEHWGSDSEGVEKTRRFLLEWLSFLYRYIPVGILERVPQCINERPPPYYGRDDMETLMASASCADWIKISEMLLGPVPDNFTFLPKHKANAYQ